MSELRIVKLSEMNAIKLGLRNDKLYFKSEVDKVIAKKDKEIAELKKERDWLAKDRAQAYDDLEKRAQLNIKQDAEIAELKEERRWRKFPDEKPEWGKEVLVLAGDGDIRRVRFSCDYKWISWGNMRTCESSCITHWMPLPSAPKEEK